MNDNADLEDIKAKLHRALDPSIPMPEVRSRDPLVIADENLRFASRAGTIICGGLAVVTVLVIILAKLTGKADPGPAVIFPVISCVGFLAFQGLGLIRTRLLRIESEMADLRKALAASRVAESEKPPTQ